MMYRGVNALASTKFLSVYYNCHNLAHCGSLQMARACWLYYVSKYALLADTVCTQMHTSVQTHTHTYTRRHVHVQLRETQVVDNNKNKQADRHDAKQRTNRQTGMTIKNSRGNEIKRDKE